MTIFNIIKWLFDKNNRNKIIFFGLFLFILLFLQQCHSNRSLRAKIEEQKEEAIRIKNNEDASKDTIRSYKANDSTYRAQISGYELKLDDLNEQYADLWASFEKEKNKPPRTIVKTVFVIKDSIKEVPVYVQNIKGKDYIVIPPDTTKFTSDNFRVFSGKIPYKMDSVKIYPGKGEFSIEQHMSLNTGLFKDKKTGKVMIKVDTEYPGITFTNIKGALIDDEESNKAKKEFRREFGIGISLGYGISLRDNVIVRSPNITIGVNYTPKWLQFGK